MSVAQTSLTDRSFGVLAATWLNEFWGGEEPASFLGRWCLPYPLDVRRPDLVARVVPYPWTTHSSRQQGFDHSRQVKQRLLAGFAEFLNEYHGFDYSIDTWNVIIGPWLQRTTMVVCHHLGCLHAAGQCNANFRVIGPRKEGAPPPTGARFAFELMLGQRHQEIFSALAEQIGMQCDRIGPSADDALGAWKPEPAEHFPTLGARIYRLVRAVPKAVARALAPHAKVVLYNATPTPRETLRLILGSGLRITSVPLVNLDLIQWPSADVSLRSNMRRRLEAVSQGDTLATAVARLSPNCLPVSFLEGFRELDSVVNRELPFRPRRVVSSMAWVCDDAFGVWAAHCKQAGSELVSAQHGGTYGIRDMPSGSEIAESEVADRFLSWGRGTSVGRKSVPLPMLPHFYVKRTVEKGSGFLFVQGVSSLLPYGFGSMADGPDAIDASERQVRFFAGLPNNVRARFLVRPYPHDFGWNEAGRLKESFPDLVIDDFSASFPDRLSAARLVVVDNMHSTYMQAMGSDIPTVLCWDARRWSTNGQATPLFDRLRNAGVLFDDPSEAAAKVAAIAADPERWWRSPAVSGPVQRFLNSYVDVQPGWVRPWLKELLR